MLAPIDDDAAVVAAERALADPHDLADGAELVEHARLEVGHARRQDDALELGEGQGDALELIDRFAQPPDAAARRADAVPARQESAPSTAASTGATSLRRRASVSRRIRRSTSGSHSSAPDAAGPELALVEPPVG